MFGLVTCGASEQEPGNPMLVDDTGHQAEKMQNAHRALP